MCYLGEMKVLLSETHESCTTDDKLDQVNLRCTYGPRRVVYVQKSTWENVKVEGEVIASMRPLILTPVGSLARADE